LKEESSFLKKRSKRLLFFGVYVSRATYAKRKKVFWFFSSEKNKPSGPDITIRAYAIAQGIWMFTPKPGVYTTGGGA
jgi:hypothetical protein